MVLAERSRRTGVDASAGGDETMTPPPSAIGSESLEQHRLDVAENLTKMAEKHHTIKPKKMRILPEEVGRKKRRGAASDRGTWTMRPKRATARSDVDTAAEEFSGTAHDRKFSGTA